MVIDNNKVPSLKQAIDEVEDSEVVERHFDAVVYGGVEVRKQSGIGKFFRQLFAEDLGMVRRTFVEDVVTPFVQDGLSGIFHDGVDLLIYGSKSGRRGRRARELFGNQRTRYDKIGRSSLSGGLLRRSYDRDDRDDDEDAEAYDDEMFIFATRAKAEDVYNAMDDALELYNAVSVADLYELAGITDMKADFTKKNWGWSSMEGIKIRRRGGKWILDLPKVEDIRDVK